MANLIAKHDYFFVKLSTTTRCFVLGLSNIFNHLIYAVVIYAGLILPGAVAAADEVKRAEAWFNEIKSIKADFVQIASDGTSAEGELLFRRPSQMKITYRNDEGAKSLRLITSKFWLHVDRPDERLVTSYPLSETPLSLILAADVSLRPDGYDTRIEASSAGVVRILIAKEEGEGAGQLTLEFSKKPFQFRRWIVVDAAGIQTSVTLLNLAFDMPIPNVAFKIPAYPTDN